jgi:hypothetical protein
MINNNSNVALTDEEEDVLINHQYDDGDTMLMRAVGRQDIYVVRYLAALGLARHDTLDREVHHTHTSMTGIQTHGWIMNIIMFVM